MIDGSSLVPNTVQLNHGLSVESRVGMRILIRLPAPIIWAIMYEALTATVENAAAERTGIGDIRYERTSASVYLPVFRIGSAIKKSTVR